MGLEVGLVIAKDVGVMLDVTVGMGVRVAVAVRVKVGVGVTVGVKVRVMVLVGVGELVDLGGLPDTVNRPERLQVIPRYICTSYSPGNQADDGALHSVYPYPPVLPSQGFVSTQTNTRSDTRYHNAVHCAPSSILS